MTQYSTITHEKNEIERCATLLSPNHTMEDPIVVVGMYRPPEREHPPYKNAYKKVHPQNSSQQTATLLMGEFNRHAWEDTEFPTYRAGTRTNGVLRAPGKYIREGTPPQEVEADLGGGRREVHPAIVTGVAVLAVHHALFLDPMRTWTG